MNYAIESLRIQLNMLETNEPIHRREGNIAQADFNLQAIAEVRAALAALGAV